MLNIELDLNLDLDQDLDLDLGLDLELDNIFSSDTWDVVVSSSINQVNHLCSSIDAVIILIQFGFVNSHLISIAPKFCTDCIDSEERAHAIVFHPVLIRKGKKFHPRKPEPPVTKVVYCEALEYDMI